MENQVYNWVVRKGHVIVQKEDECVSLQLDYENGDYCLLTYSDATEIIEILITLSKQIWENPSYKRLPYTNRLYKISGNEYHWEIKNSKLILKYNETEDGIEARYIGSSKLTIEINYVIEIIQIMEQLNQ